MMVSDDCMENRANFYAGLGAVSLVVSAALFGVYALQVVRPRLPEEYQRRASSLMDRLEGRSPHPNQSLVETAGELEICLSRLDSFSVQPVDPWRQLETVDRLIQEIRRSPPSTERESEERRKEVLRKLDQRLGRLIERLRTAGTEDQIKFATWYGRRALRDGTSADGRRQAIDELRRVAATSRDGGAKMVLARLLIEQAWETALACSDSPPDRALLTEAFEAIETLDEAPAALSRDSMLEILVHLDAGRAIELARSSDGTAHPIVRMDERWSDHPEKLWHALDLRTAILGDWSGVQRELQNAFRSLRYDTAVQRRIAQATGNQCGRLLLSGLPSRSSSWCTAAPNFVNLAQDLHPASRELACFLWRAGRQHAGIPAGLDDRLIEAILIHPDGSARFLILSISASIRQQPDQALAYLRTGARSDASIFDQVGHIAVWYSSTGETEHLESWDGMLTRILDEHPDRGIDWLAAGLIAMANGRWDQAETRLKKARQRLGSSPAFDSLMQQVQAGRRGSPQVETTR